jgi:ketosteroid isomerase-like protein
MSANRTAASTDGGEAIDQFYEALTRNDVAAALALCTPDARFWHCFDGDPQDLETASRGWAGMAAAFAQTGFADVRRTPTGDGRYLQQQLFWAQPASGKRIAWAVCMIVELRDGRIARLDEYIDRAGAFDLPSLDVVTRGLPPRQ